MIFVFAEDGTLEVVDDLGQAQRYEPLDVESGVFVFYDEDGTWLKPGFSTPNRRRSFGRSSVPVVFELARSKEPDPTVDSFDVALQEATGLKPNKYFENLAAVRRYVALKRPRDENLEDA